jgi:hypothetical protein
MSTKHPPVIDNIDNQPVQALRFAQEANAAEQMIVDALPTIITKLVSMAKDGNIAAARYLVDRILGRVSRLPSPPAVDHAITHTHRSAPVDIRTNLHNNEIKTVCDPRKRPDLAANSRICPTGAKASAGCARPTGAIPGIGAPLSYRFP